MFAVQPVDDIAQDFCTTGACMSISSLHSQAQISTARIKGEDSVKYFRWTGKFAVSIYDEEALEDNTETKKS